MHITPGSKWHKDTIELEKDSFEETITECERLVMVMIYTNSCLDCRSMEPMNRKVNEKIRDTADLFLVNPLRYHDNAFKYRVQAVPTLKFFCKGTPIGEIVGAVNMTIQRNTIKDFTTYRQKCVKGSSKLVYKLTGYA